MSNAVQFLEALGRSHSAIQLSSAGYATAVESLDIDSSQRRALLQRDHAKLNDVIGGRAMMMCVLLPADDDQKDDEQPEGEEPTPSEKDQAN